MNLFKESDLILYIVRTDLLLNHDSFTEKRAEDDLQQIKEWIKGSNSKKQFFIVGNHWNTDPIYKNLTPDQKGDYQDKFTSLPVVKRMTLLAGGSSTVKVVLGSLASEADADTLISTIFRQVNK